MMESRRYQQIGGWWLGKDSCRNRKGNSDEMEIDIVAVTVDDEVEVYEVKRNEDKYRESRLREKVEQMQKHLFKGREIALKGLSMKDM